MSLTGYLGRVGRLDETDLPAALNQRVAKVSVKSKALLFDGFLYRVLDSQWFRDQIEVYGRGAAQQNVGTSDISKIEIPVPPLEEQKRIVAILDAASARVTELAACYEQARTHSNNLFTSALREALKGNPDWPVKTLGDILTFSYGKPLEPKDRDDNGAIPVYGANGVKARSKRSLVSGPSIIVGRKGSAGELNFCDGPFWPLDVTYFVEHDVKVTDLTFLHYLLSFMDLPSLAKGVKPGINRNDVYVLQSPVPPLEEQKRIVARLDAMRAKTSEMIAAYDAKLKAAKNLRQSVLEAAFAGQL
jgi:type I restriction enzyme S subunit